MKRLGQLAFIAVSLPGCSVDRSNVVGAIWFGLLIVILCCAAGPGPKGSGGSA
jgi:hypothetical protein